MLGFLISTIAFSLAAYVLNRYLDARGLDSISSRKVIVMTVATLISIGTGWAVDKLDGDSELHQQNITITDAIQNGDPIQIAKILAGINW